jgi:hypothetical protein
MGCASMVAIQLLLDGASMVAIHLLIQQVLCQGMGGCIPHSLLQYQAGGPCHFRYRCCGGWWVMSKMRKRVVGDQIRLHTRAPEEIVWQTLQTYNPHLMNIIDSFFSRFSFSPPPLFVFPLFLCFQDMMYVSLFFLPPHKRITKRFVSPPVDLQVFV